MSAGKSCKGKGDRKGRRFTRITGCRSTRGLPLLGRSGGTASAGLHDRGRRGERTEFRGGVEERTERRRLLRERGVMRQKRTSPQLRSVVLYILRGALPWPHRVNRFLTASTSPAPAASTSASATSTQQRMNFCEDKNNSFKERQLRSGRAGPGCVTPSPFTRHCESAAGILLKRGLKAAKEEKAGEGEGNFSACCRDSHDMTCRKLF